MDCIFPDVDLTMKNCLTILVYDSVKSVESYIVGFRIFRFLSTVVLKSG